MFFLQNIKIFLIFLSNINYFFEFCLFSARFDTACPRHFLFTVIVGVAYIAMILYFSKVFTLLLTLKDLTRRLGDASGKEKKKERTVRDVKSSHLLRFEISDEKYRKSLRYPPDAREATIREIREQSKDDSCFTL